MPTKSIIPTLGTRLKIGAKILIEVVTSRKADGEGPHKIKITVPDGMIFERLKPRKVSRAFREKLAAAPHASTGEHFEAFWEAWPRGRRKQSKGRARAWWTQYKLDKIADKVMAVLEFDKHSQQWRDGFDPMPMKWLRRKRYLDDLDDCPDTPGAGPVGPVAGTNLTDRMDHILNGQREDP